MPIMLELKEDIKANQEIRTKFFFYLYRYGHYFNDKKSHNYIFKCFDIFTRLIYRLTVNKYNHIPLETVIGGGLRCPHLMGIIIAGNAVIGNNCTIFHQVTIGIDELKGREAPVIGDNVYIGAGAKIIGNVYVGSNSKIGANAVITKDVPVGATVVGCNSVVNIQ